jgi:hypothetical protein
VNGILRFAQNDNFSGVILRTKSLPTGRQAKDPMAFISLCHPESISSKDPTAFSNNQQSLAWMGFFASLRMTAEKECSLILRMTDSV